jgi:dUTP pyrophosphatase
MPSFLIDMNYVSFPTWLSAYFRAMANRLCPKPSYAEEELELRVRVHKPSLSVDASTPAFMGKDDVKALVETAQKEYEETFKYYKNIEAHYEGDAGIDLVVPWTTDCPAGKTTLVDLGVSCEMVGRDSGKPYSYWLFPRSSIAKSQVFLHNSVGVIDASYRGTIKAALRPLVRDSGIGFSATTITLNRGSRPVQIVSPGMRKIHVKVVDELSATERGEKGFGSTGATSSNVSLDGTERQKEIKHQKETEKIKEQLYAPVGKLCADKNLDMKKDT